MLGQGRKTGRGESLAAGEGVMADASNIRTYFGLSQLCAVMERPAGNAFQGAGQTNVLRLVAAEESDLLQSKC